MDMHIERLTLKLDGWSESSAERLAQRLATALGQITTLETVPSYLDTLHVHLTAPADSSVDRLTQLLIAEVLRQLQRTPA